MSSSLVFCWCHSHPEGEATPPVDRPFKQFQRAGPVTTQQLVMEGEGLLKWSPAPSCVFLFCPGGAGGV